MKFVYGLAGGFIRDSSYYYLYCDDTTWLFYW